MSNPSYTCYSDGRQPTYSGPMSQENTAADGVELSAEQIQRLNDLTPATGERHDEANMAAIDG